MMNVTDEDLILYILEELDDSHSQSIEAAIKKDSNISRRLEQISLTIDATNHWQYQADSGLEQRIVNQVDARISYLPQSQPKQLTTIRERLSGWISQPAFIVAAVAIAMTLAFMSGRLLQHQQIMDNPEQLIASLDDEARDNILMQSVALHLERTSRLMTSVSVSDSPDLEKQEQEWASRLLSANRLFKVAAQQAQQWRIVRLLEEIEPLLIEMATSESDELTTREHLKHRIDSNGLVFKTRNFSDFAKPAI